MSRDHQRADDNLAAREAFMRRAISLSEAALDSGGGPFGAVIVTQSRIVGEGKNEVTTSNDPTAHAEMLAIREAAKNLKTYDLRGCVLYSSCEPCPMCLGAAFWARLDHVFYANTQKDAAAIGFDDATFYEELSRAPEKRQLKLERMLGEEAIAIFQRWAADEHRRLY